MKPLKPTNQKNKFMKKLLLVLTAVIISLVSFAQCMMIEIPLDQRAKASDLVIEGRVIEKNCYWDAHQTTIYTVNTVEVYKVFKGTISTSSIQVLTSGGRVDDRAVIVHPALELNIGDVGVFTCETVKRFDVVSNVSRTQMPQFEAYGGAQGFVQYNSYNETANDAFKSYKNIEKEVYSVVLDPSLKNYRTVKKFDVHSINNKVATLGVASISSFSPTTITAGTKSVLTINGSGFGSTPGTISFKNADNGGSSTVNAIATQILTWTDAQITVEVPNKAGTGTFQVGGASSPSPITITYNITNYNSDFNGNKIIVASPIDHVDKNGTGGYTWHMTTGFDGNAAAKASFTRAFNSWRCNTGINWQLGTTTSVDQMNAKDNVCTIRFGTDLPQGAVGVCQSGLLACGSPGGTAWTWYVDDLDITFTPNVSYEYGPAPVSGQNNDFESIAVHELGHGHQQGHVINTADIMHFQLAGGTSRRVLAPANINGGLFVQAQSEVANACGPGAMINYGGCTAPVVAFSGDQTTICAGKIVNFADKSTGSPASWKWAFQGGNPPTATTKSVTVTYTASGTYSVSLKVTNNNGSDSTTKTTYIKVNPSPVLTTTTTPTNCANCKTGTAKGNATGGTAPYTYAWSTSPIQTTQTATGLGSGSYTVCITDSKGCIACNTASVGVGVGITESNPNSTISVYPNPVIGGQFTVAGIQSSGELMLYNFIGEVVYQTTINGKQKTINLPEVNEGIYFLKVKSEEGIETRKLVFLK